MKSVNKPRIKSLVKAFMIIIIFMFCMCKTKNYAYASRTAATGGAESNNAGNNNYGTWADVIQSYLVANEDGSFSRVEVIDNKIVVETYNSSYKLQRSTEIPMELSLFGGFYSGTDGNYFVFGQTNEKQSSNVECYRIVKYSKSWERIGDCGLCDCNTTIPFYAGSLRFAQYGKMLYIRTCHQMYTSSDGRNHQANVPMSIDTDQMIITDKYCIVMNISQGYVSHSFNQFIQVSQNQLVAVDHGDAYPRSVVLVKYDNPAGMEKFTGSCQYKDLLSFPGSIGENYTGGSVGGFEVSQDTYLIAGNYTNLNDKIRNIFISVTDQNNFMNESKLVYLTDYSKETAGTPQLVKITDDRFLVMWEMSVPNSEKASISYVFIDSQGNTLSAIQSLKGRLSDCQPIVNQGKVIWYYTAETKPIFCSIPADGSVSTDNSIVGDTFNYGKLTYKVTKNTNKTKTVAVTGVTKYDITTLNVPDTVSLGKEKFVVTEISNYAFSSCYKLKKLTIGKNVKKIGKGITCSWSENITCITLKGEVLSSVGKDALEGMQKGKILVSKKKLNKYKKLLNNKGQGYQVKIIGF